MPRRSKKDDDGIYQRKDSPCWWISYQDASGRQTRRSTGIPVTTDPKGLKALAHRAALVAALDAAPTPPSPPSGPTWDDLLLAYLSEVTPGKRAPQRDRSSAKHLLPVFTGRALANIGVADVRAYIRDRQAAGALPGTINREIGLMSAATTWAQRELEWDITNPWFRRRLREPDGRTRWLSADEAARLVDAARAGRGAAHLPAFILLALHAGLRLQEALGLEWSRVDLARRRLYLGAVNQKNGKVAEVPINSVAREALIERARYRAEHCPDSPWVFCHHDGSRLTTIRHGFASACIKADIEDCHPHDLRRTCGSWLVQAGVDISRVARILRHSNVNVTARVYAHLRTEDLEDDIEGLTRRAGRG